MEWDDSEGERSGLFCDSLVGAGVGGFMGLVSGWLLGGWLVGRLGGGR